MPSLPPKGTLISETDIFTIKKCGHKKATIAIIRMLLIAIYNILSNSEVYNSELYRRSNPDSVVHEQQAIRLL